MRSGSPPTDSSHAGDGKKSFRKFCTFQIATDVETVGHTDTNGFGIPDAFPFVLLAK